MPYGRRSFLSRRQGWLSSLVRCQHNDSTTTDFSTVPLGAELSGSDRDLESVARASGLMPAIAGAIREQRHGCSFAVLYGNSNGTAYDASDCATVDEARVDHHNVLKKRSIKTCRVSLHS